MLQYNTHAHRETVELLQRDARLHFAVHLTLNQSGPRNPVDCQIWATTYERVYQTSTTLIK